MLGVKKKIFLKSKGSLWGFLCRIHVCVRNLCCSRVVVSVLGLGFGLINVGCTAGGWFVV